MKNGKTQNKIEKAFSQYEKHHNFAYKNLRKILKNYLDLKEERNRQGRGMGEVLDQKCDKNI